MTNEKRIEFEATNFYRNGAIISGKYIPFELLLEIFTRIDHNTLLSCQLVCKHWLKLIRNYTWREKTELLLNRKLSNDIRWEDCYAVLCKQPFNRNLVKNHSGGGKLEYWTTGKYFSDKWQIENPPVGAPELPDDPIFQGERCCFVTTLGDCAKSQVIDLTREGLSENLLDTVQPTIRISEWFCSRYDCPCTYACEIQLIGKRNSVLKSYAFEKSMKYKSMRYQWFHFATELKNYGRGLNKIKFTHYGKDGRWTGCYGSKMAGACVKLIIPD